MPTYDYECTVCKKVMEIFQQMSEAPLEKCPECGGEIKRLIGGGLGVIFKGNGFYATDSKKKNNESAEQSKNKSTEKNISSSEGKNTPSECGSCQASSTCPASEKK